MTTATPTPRAAAGRLLVLSIGLAGSLSAQDWPMFRGPAGDGRGPEGAVPISWSREENVKWRAPLPRPANGSPIVSNGRVFLTCPEDAEGRRRALLCFDRTTGERLWVRTVEYGKKMPTHKTNPYGGTTPAADGKRVVVWHASAGLHCYDFDGKEMWKRDFGEFRHQWGYGTSPVLHDGKVILHTGPGRQVFVVAVDLATGATIWKTDEPVAGDGQYNAEKRLLGSWCTPLVARVDGATQILCTMATRLVAYDPGDGRILWTCGGLPCKNGDLAYSSPSIAGDICLVLGGFEGPEIGVRLDRNRGDVTETRRLWRMPRRPSNCGSGVVVDGFLYIPDMRGVLCCVKPETGERVWSERAAKAAIWSSIVHAGGKLYATDQDGTTIVFEPSPEKLQVLARNSIPETTNSTPAIAGGEIFLRTHENLYCIAQPPSPPVKPDTGKAPARRR